MNNGSGRPVETGRLSEGGWPGGDPEGQAVAAGVRAGWTSGLRLRLAAGRDLRLPD